MRRHDAAVPSRSHGTNPLHLASIPPPFPSTIGTSMWLRSFGVVRRWPGRIRGRSRGPWRATAEGVRDDRADNRWSEGAQPWALNAGVR